VKPLIGITAGEIQNKLKPWSPIVYGQTHHYVDSIISAGGIPIIIPLTRDLSVLDVIYAKLDGLLFSGGNDIDPANYGEKPRADNLDISKLRDKVDLHLVRRALKDQKPTLGICRGMQLINVACGGKLYQDIPKDLPNAQDHEASSHAGDVTHIAHSLKIAEHSKLAALVGTEPLQTNAHHHQAVKTVGDNLQAVAWAEDGIIEAIENPGDPFVFGIQSHPESLTAMEQRWRKLFEALVEASQAQQQAPSLKAFELETA
jgi:putative glutamine amidotransferase